MCARLNDRAPGAIAKTMVTEAYFEILLGGQFESCAIGYSARNDRVKKHEHRRKSHELGLR